MTHKQFTYDDYMETVDAIRSRTRYRPTIGLVLGSGLSSLADDMDGADVIATESLPHWPRSTVEGHSGRLVFGRLRGHDVLIQQGRIHFYEGYTLQQVTLPVRVMKLLGIDTYILTNAAGGLNPAFSVGDLMLITDHIGFVGMTGSNPLFGPNDERFGPRFPDMTFAYDRGLQQVARDAAAQVGFSLREGVYGWISGPNFETPAEIRFLHAAGADSVGMSTVPSVIVARHAGMRVLGISTITNVAPHHPQPDHVTSHEEVMETGAIVVPRLRALLEELVSRL
jgi:purine-nucleoside phosphorylase